MDIDAVLTETWGIYKRFFTHLATLALGVFLVTNLISTGLIHLGSGSGTTALLTLVSIGVSMVGSAWLTGALVEATVDLRDGRQDLTIGQLLQRVRPFIVPIILAGLVTGLGIVAGLVLLIIPGLFLLTIWAVVIPVVVVERSAVFAALSRSRELVRGHGWQVFGVLVVILVIAMVASLVISGVLGAVLSGFVGDWISGTIANTIIMPFMAVAQTIMYLRLVERSGTPAV